MFFLSGVIVSPPPMTWLPFVSPRKTCYATPPRQLRCCWRNLGPATSSSHLPPHVFVPSVHLDLLLFSFYFPGVVSTQICVLGRLVRNSSSERMGPILPSSTSLLPHPRSKLDLLLTCSFWTLTPLGPCSLYCSSVSLHPLSTFPSLLPRSFPEVLPT